MSTGRSIEALRAEIEQLVAERQELRAARVSADVLEANRVQLAAAQSELSLRLIEQHRPDDEAAA